MDDILPEDVEMVAQGIRRAAALYPDTAAIRALQVAAMKAAKDFSWVKATRQYVDHFVERRRPGRRPPRRASARRLPRRPCKVSPSPFLLSRSSISLCPPARPPPLPSDPAGLTRHRLALQTNTSRALQSPSRNAPHTHTHMHIPHTPCPATPRLTPRPARRRAWELCRGRAAATFATFAAFAAFAAAGLGPPAGGGGGGLHHHHPRPWTAGRAPNPVLGHAAATQRC